MLRGSGIVAIFISSLIGCASTGPSEVQRARVAAIHEAELVLITDADLLHPGITEPNYDAAPDLVTAYSMRGEYERRLAAAQTVMRPLIAELSPANTKAELGDSIKQALVSSGITVYALPMQFDDGTAHSEKNLEARLANSPRGSALVVVVPVLSMSADYRTVSLEVDVRVYIRGSTSPSVDRHLIVKSDTVVGADPIGEWSASSGAAFFHWVDQGGATLGTQAAGIFK